MGKLVDRLTGRADAALCDAVVQWSRASQALLSLISTGSVISADDRGLVLELLHERLDGLLPIEGFDADQLMSLERRLRADLERCEQTAEVS